MKKVKYENFQLATIYFSLQRGFSLVELTLVISVVVLLLSLATLNLFQFQHGSQLSATVSSFLADYKGQQIKAMVGDTSGSGNLSNYGIFFGTNSYTEFQNTYGTANFTINLPSVIQFSTTFPGSQILFLKGSGEVSGFTNGQNTITLKDTSTGAQVILTVNRYGVISNYSTTQPPIVGTINLSPNPVTINTSESALASFTSSNPPDTASWNWGDGSTTGGTVTESNNSGSVTNNHTYTAWGSYTITLTVTNNNNISGSSSVVAAVIPTTGFCNANLSHTNYSGANFANQNLCQANISNAIFNNVNFNNANLSQINGSNSSFTGTNFTNANANKANFNNSNLTGANFTNTILTQANLSNSNFTNVNFTGANLTGANTNGATLTGVTWSNTICPNGTNSNSDNNTCVGEN